MEFSRRAFLKTVSVATAASVFGGCTSQWIGGSNNKKPNIIYILADDLGYGDLGCYGQRAIQTPNLDRMAAEGMRFSQHYAGSTVCAPSRCVLMTGLHTGHARIRGNRRVPLLSEDVTVAEQLKQAGYATGLVGKWGLGEPGTTGIPNRQGFDTFFGYLNQAHAHNYYPEYLWENEAKIRLNNVVEHTKTGYAKGVGGVATKRVEYSHDLFVEKALNFIDARKNAPFFLYLALTIPHANNEAGIKGMEVPDLGVYADKDWPQPQKGHAAMISRMDSDIGKIFDRLKTLGIDENTIVMFSSDNGPHAEGGNDPHFNDSNGPLRGIKRDLYEGGIRVPFIVRWPGKVKAGSESGHVSGFQDVLPTCAEIAGMHVPDDIDGISFVPTLLETGKQRQHAYLYWEFHEQGSKQAVRMGQWKAVRLNVTKKPDGPIELYDLSKDMGEEENMAAEHPQIIEEMESIMKDARTSNEVFKLLPSEHKKK